MADGPTNAGGHESLEGLRAGATRWAMPHPGLCPHRGGTRSHQGVLRHASRHVARHPTERACTGTRQAARAGRHGRPSPASPPAGPTEGPWGGSCRARVHVCTTPILPSVPPTHRGSGASGWRAAAAARTRVLERRVWWLRASARQASGRVKGTRTSGTGRRIAWCRCRHAWAAPCWPVGPWRCWQACECSWAAWPCAQPSTGPPRVAVRPCAMAAMARPGLGRIWALHVARDAGPCMRKIAARSTLTDPPGGGCWPRQPSRAPGGSEGCRERSWRGRDGPDPRGGGAG
jgi:hypothetical protein